MSRCGHTPAEVKMLGGITELSVGSSLCYGFEAACPFCGGRFAAGYTRAGALELGAGRLEVSLHTPRAAAHRAVLQRVRAHGPRRVPGGDPALPREER